MGFAYHFRPALVLLVCLTLITGLLYPFTITAIAQVLFPVQANGSLIVQGGQVAGSTLIGQPFSNARYFWSRPSATAPFAYNAAASGGSNWGPTSEMLLRQIRARVAELREVDPGNLRPIPVDLVTASASGLDPHISLAAAEYQVARVSRARGLDERQVRALVAAYTERRQFLLLGEPRVNVLQLNLALDMEEAKGQMPTR